MEMKDYRLKFTKKEDMIYISHLDLMRLWQRVFRRAGIAVKHTEGFNPQPKIAFATALALGTESDAEYMDVELENDVELDFLIEKLNEKLPSGIEVLKGQRRQDKASIMSLIEWGTYEVQIKLLENISKEDAEKEIEKFLALDEIIDIRERKKKKKITLREVNIKELIKELKIVDVTDDYIKLFMLLKTGSNGNLKPEVVVNKLSEYTDLKIETELPIVYRKELLVERDGNIEEPI